MESASLHSQPYTTACNSNAVRKLSLANASQRGHYGMCLVAFATVYNCMHSNAVRKLSLSNASQRRHYGMCLVAFATVCNSTHSNDGRKLSLSYASQRRHYGMCLRNDQASRKSTGDQPSLFDERLLGGCLM